MLPPPGMNAAAESGTGPERQMRTSPGRHLDGSPVRPWARDPATPHPGSREPQKPGKVNGCCFKLSNLVVTCYTAWKTNAEGHRWLACPGRALGHRD